VQSEWLCFVILLGVAASDLLPLYTEMPNRGANTPHLRPKNVKFCSIDEKHA